MTDSKTESLRLAASLILLRPTLQESLEVFMFRRRRTMAFAPGMVVFPGGAIDPDDYHHPRVWIGPSSSWWAERFHTTSTTVMSLVQGVIRETFEETGVLFCSSAQTPHHLLTSTTNYHSIRYDLASHQETFSHFLIDKNLILHTDHLRPWAHWITPKTEPTRRYDTYFFLACIPPGQQPDNNNTESDQAFWITPAHALEEFERKTLFLLPPTWALLRTLVGHSLDQLLASTHHIDTIEPELVYHSHNRNNWDAYFPDCQQYNTIRRKHQRE